MGPERLEKSPSVNVEFYSITKTFSECMYVHLKVASARAKRPLNGCRNMRRFKELKKSRLRE